MGLPVRSSMKKRAPGQNLRDEAISGLMPLAKRAIVSKPTQWRWAMPS